MLYTLKAPIFGRLFIGPEDVGHMKARRNDIEVELRTSRPADRPGIAVPVEEVAITTRVPPNKLDEFILEVGQEPIPGGVLSELRQRLLLEMQTFESGFAFAYGDEFPIEKIAWERWIEEFTPETDIEREKLKLTESVRFAPRASRAPWLKCATYGTILSALTGMST